MMNIKIIRWSIVLLTGFIALTAIGGGLALLLGAEGDRFPLEWLAGTPFVDYTIPALLLTAVVGGSSLVACVLVATGRRLGAMGSLLAGGSMMGFIAVEAAILKQVPPGPTTIEFFYFVVGLMIAALAAFWLWQERQPKAEATFS